MPLRYIRRPFPNRREFLAGAVATPAVLTGLVRSQAPIEGRYGDFFVPISEHHFPNPLHQFVWRNWELANAERMARVVGATSEQIVQLGKSMGLPAKPILTGDQLRRIYITVIRQNWHLLPEEQLIALLDWDREHYDFTLREDDFLWYKLGPKPKCGSIRWAAPTPEETQRAAEIRRLVTTTFGKALHETGEEPFRFVGDLSRDETRPHRDPRAQPDREEIDLSGWAVRIPVRTELMEMAQRFRSYLRHTMQCPTRAAGEGGRSSGGTLRFLLAPDPASIPDSFEIRVESASVTVLASDPGGIRQGIYEMQMRMERRQGPFLPQGTIRRVRRLETSYLYSYVALYGDPLMEEDIDPFPAAYLEKLARLGVNGVWLQGVLRQLSPSSIFPEFGGGWQTRLERLNRLVNRCARYGMKVLLYINEPRAMPESFFRDRPGLKGTSDADDPRYFAMCTNTELVLQWVSEGLSHVFAQVPDLGGIVNITMSENLTNCFSRGRPENCPRCPGIDPAETVAAVLKAIRDGIRSSSRKAEIIFWDWGWGHSWVPNGNDPFPTIRRLPQDVRLLSVSEWEQPVHRGGVRTRVGEYSVSVVGPGPRAVRHWTAARQRGISTLAKIQINNSWELAAVPYIPVLNLIQRHLENLLRVGIEGLMLSWTVGGYPSPNLEVAREYCRWPTPNSDEVLTQVAERRYGPKAAALVKSAWKSFGEAFEEYPYGISIYMIPVQHGPANLLRSNPTGHRSRMTLFPHDDVPGWRGAYPEDVVEKQFRKMSEKWEEGLDALRRALKLVPEHLQAEARKDLGVGETCFIHFRSVANQVKFYRLRQQLESGTGDLRRVRAEMTALCRDEIDLTRRLYPIARRDSRLGYEASNHYYYRPLDLAEKVLNCDRVIRELERS